jgi:hypothetical protein
MVRRLMVVLVAACGAFCVGQTMPGMRRATPTAAPLVLATRLPEEARIGQVVGREVVANWREVLIEAQAMDMDPAATKGAHWEIRSGDGKRVVRTVPMPWDLHSGAAKVTGVAGEFTLPAADSKALEKEGDGTFLAAWIIEGERRSNVVKIVVDTKHELKDEPLVRTVIGEPPAAGMAPTVGVTVLRRTEVDPAISSIYLAIAQWTIDGQPVARMGGITINHVEQLAVGKAASRVLSGAEYQVTLDGTRPHTISATIQTNKSEPVKFVPGMPLGEAWDKGDAAASGAAKEAGGAP